MQVLDVESLLEPISDDEPCGEALDYDLDFMEFEIAARGKPAQQLGDATVAAEPPDWPEVVRLGEALARRSKDLRIGVALTRAAVGVQGFTGLRDGLSLLAGYTERYWSGLHPVPDVDDGDDQTVRVLALANLCDPEGLLLDLRRAPIAQPTRQGPRAFGDWYQAQRGGMEGEAGDPAAVEAALQGTDSTWLVETYTALSEALLALERIDKAQRAQVDATLPVDLRPLRDMMQMAATLLERFQPVADGAEASTAALQPAAEGDGAIRSREDVVATIERICRWYRINEPASPVPMLLERAKKLVSKDFLSLLMEVAPEGAGQFRALAGMTMEDA